MHLIQIGYGIFIDARHIEYIYIQKPIGRLKIITTSKEIHYVNDQLEDQAIKDILMNCTPTSGRDALQGMVSE